MTDNICNNCKIEMQILREEINGETNYIIFKCNKCKHQIARQED